MHKPDSRGVVATACPIRVDSMEDAFGKYMQQQKNLVVVGRTLVKI